MNRQVIPSILLSVLIVCFFAVVLYEREKGQGPPGTSPGSPQAGVAKNLPSDSSPSAGTTAPGPQPGPVSTGLAANRAASHPAIEPRAPAPPPDPRGAAQRPEGTATGSHPVPTNPSLSSADPAQPLREASFRVSTPREKSSKIGMQDRVAIPLIDDPLLPNSYRRRSSRTDSVR